MKTAPVHTLLIVAEQGGRRTGFQHLNDTGYWDDAPTTTNYTTGKLFVAAAQVCIQFCCFHIT
jgi:hypothetical protein